MTECKKYHGNRRCGFVKLYKHQGLIKPLVVRPVTSDVKGYRLIGPRDFSLVRPVISDVKGYMLIGQQGIGLVRPIIGQVRPERGLG